jgi:predicted GNAT family acetyltransferase
MQGTVQLGKNTAAKAYEIAVDDAVAGRAWYSEDGGVVSFPSVVVDPASRGRGLGERLTKFALDDVIESGKKIRPICSFVVAYVKRHAEYQSHLAGPAESIDDGSACAI